MRVRKTVVPVTELIRRRDLLSEAGERNPILAAKWFAALMMLIAVNNVMMYWHSSWRWFFVVLGICQWCCSLSVLLRPLLISKIDREITLRHEEIEPTRTLEEMEEELSRLEQEIPVDQANLDKKSTRRQQLASDVEVLRRQLFVGDGALSRMTDAEPDVDRGLSQVDAR